MKTLRQQYQDLEFQVNVEYRTLIDKIGTIDFFIESEDEDFDELTECENITFVGRDGDNIDGYVLSIDSKEGIYIALYEDESVRFLISLNDLASLYSKITVVELLEAAQKQNKDNDKLIERSIKASI